MNGRSLNNQEVMCRQPAPNTATDGESATYFSPYWNLAMCCIFMFPIVKIYVLFGFNNPNVILASYFNF